MYLNTIISKLFLPISLCISLTACGFQPLHAPDQSVHKTAYLTTEALALTEIGWVENREGQILRQSLERQMNPRGDQRQKKWHLALKRSEYQQQLNLQKDETARRARLVQVVNFSLVDKTNGAEIFSGQEQVSSSFFIPQETDQIFSLTVSRTDARERSLRLASEAIVRRLSLFFNNPQMMQQRQR